MNRWAARILGLILILIFTLVFVQMYRSLVKLQEQQGVTKSSSRRVVRKSGFLSGFETRAQTGMSLSAWHERGAFVGQTFLSAHFRA